MQSKTTNIVPCVRRGLNANKLKIIAIIAMTIDHLALIFFPRYSLEPMVIFFHIIGRLTAPIMMFFIVEGYYYTKDLKKYIIRLFIFAIVSHFAYALAFNKSFIPFQDTIFDQTSVIWAFALGLVALTVRKYENPKLKSWHRHVIITVCVFAAFCADWSTPAALAILYMGINRGDFKKQMLWLVFCIAMYAIVYAVFLNPVYGAIQMLVVMAIPLLRSYNGERGKWKGMKWFFYVYYPLHLVILGLIRMSGIGIY